jgi:histidinol-phosphate/aromatic aminotransferase/cobyric acid decarboxylase-like protein
VLERAAIEALCTQLSNKSLIVVDEAYIEFAKATSMVQDLERFPNLVILRTLSKAYALAGARCGALIAHEDIIGLLARVITPYALPTHTIDAVLHMTDEEHVAESKKRIKLILTERTRVSEALASLPLVRKVWPSDSNFILVDCNDADAVMRAAISAGLIIRDPRSQLGLGNSLRISIGTPDQNDRLIRGVAQASGELA